MKIYPDEFKWKEKMDRIPRALQEREFAALDNLTLQQGFKITKTGTDKHGKYAEVSVRPGTSMQAVNQYLEDMAVSALTVRPEDIESIYGKSIVTLGMSRKVLYDGDSDVAMLTPEELQPALDRLQVSSQFGGPVSEEVEQWIEMDLLNEGYLTDEQVASHDAWLSPPAPAAPRPYDGGEDWTPNNLADEWGDQ